MFTPRAIVIASAALLLLGGGLACKSHIYGPKEPLAGATRRWTFDDDAPGRSAVGFRTVAGTFTVADDAHAFSGARTLRQVGIVPEREYTYATVDGVSAADLQLRVRFRFESGEIDQAGGLMFRVKDAKNYYLARANALEQNVRLYRVVDGVRERLGNYTLEGMRAGLWYTLEIEARGERLLVRWNGEPVLQATDGAYKTGGIGIWSKADSITTFDDLEMAP